MPKALAPKSQLVKIKSDLALIPLKEAVMFPRLSVPLVIGEDRSVKALEEVLKSDNMAFFVATHEAPPSEIKKEHLYEIGTVAKILETVRQPDNSYRVFIEGLSRARLKEYLREDPYFKVKIELLPEPEVKKTEKVEALMYSVVNQFKEVVNMGATVPFDVLLVIMNITDPWQLSDLIAVNMDFKVTDKQALLEANDAEDKLNKLSQALGRQAKVLRMARKIQADTGKELSKMEKEMMLREQLKTIEKELGIIGGRSEVQDLREKIEAAGMPDNVKQVATKELGRLEGMPSFSPEISYIRTYLDWLISVPWAKKDESKIDLKAARTVLDQDHYGLDKVKERVLEYLAVQKLVGKIRGPILCFAGPPGTGKTSIGKSIARSLGRKFVRISLGGIRDEAEIRGHRRTYVGALPGRIIQGLVQAGTRNPIFMLDEIDKVGADFRGDPSAALLEALDPEQNYAFSDHYVEVPVDLSDVMFITTANMLDTVPPALRDRMEVIEYPGYTEDEKYHIARKYLLPKQMEANGLKVEHLEIVDQAIREVIRYYTREAGVRNLERELSAICRKVAREVAEGNAVGKVTAREIDLEKYLGPHKFSMTLAEKGDEVGVVTGLAWTEAGGDILMIEATRMPGKGNLILTGHLGKVMQESVQAALSFARSKADKLKIKDASLKNEDIHVHVPAGAIPKDGPSAGVAMAVALVSILTGKKVRKEVAMTGEVTLRGNAMEIGGVKEKVLAAHRAGIKTVILPCDNEKDLVEIPEHIKKDLKFAFVSNMDEVFKVALV